MRCICINSAGSEAEQSHCEGILPGCTVGNRQAEHESHRKSMEKDNMVKSRVGNSLSTGDKPMREEGL